MDIFEQVQALHQEVENTIIESAEALEQFRIKFLGSKNVLKDIFGQIKVVPNERKKEFGQLVNAVKDAASEKYNTLKDTIASNETVNTKSQLDLSLNGTPLPLGARHPIQLVKNQIVEIFARIGYSVAVDREIEDDWHNFTALNMPEDHPARDMQDTFYISLDPAILLRTHTSSVQIRTMEQQKPPIRIIAPGRVFRNETISARAHCFFHQVEGLYIDKNVSFADLLQSLDYFVKEMFGQNTQIRLRPSYFPFTEPSAEVDVSCFICNSKGCNVCKYTGWVEILGCGMVDPAVLENCNIDANEYSGFAFGMGIERITMLKYQINDLRLFSENDIRFLNQFKAAH
ncbi:MAG: phenylalanine--tRNA ligase subunit alpha [Chitinophagales bacterium]|nr:phenylalanine--tRNA ligase subunit alpha [Chitinophagales bacterium]